MVHESQTLVHIFQQCKQDSSIVSSIMQHAVETIQRSYPELKEVFFCSDNAGCYHNSRVLQRAPTCCKRIDFSEPQGGKGACDRMAATIKAHIGIYVNDVETAFQMKEAIESNGGISGVQVFVCASILDKVSEETMLLTQDWAMKYVPRRYRESQTQWFGKRGMPWHLTHVTRYCNGTYESQTLVNIFQQCKQDSSIVSSIMQHAVETIQRSYPELKEVFFCSDNAGCYHNSRVLQRAPTCCKRIDFSEPQGGKGACDRMAATIKAHIGIYVNDVETSFQMKEAIESNGGISGVQVFVCASQEQTDEDTTPIENISQLTNFEYVEEGILGWKAYNLGTQSLIPIKQKKAPQLNILVSTHNPQCAFKELQTRKQAVSTEQSEGTSAHIEEAPANQATLFSCPEEGCVMSFRRVANLSSHLMVDRHTRAPDSLSFHDKAKLLYKEKLEAGTRTIPVVRSHERAQSQLVIEKEQDL